MSVLEIINVVYRYNSVDKSYIMQQEALIQQESMMPRSPWKDCSVAQARGSGPTAASTSPTSMSQPSLAGGDSRASPSSGCFADDRFTRLSA